MPSRTTPFPKSPLASALIDLATRIAIHRESEDIRLVHLGASALIILGDHPRLAPKIATIRLRQASAYAQKHFSVQMDQLALICIEETVDISLSSECNSLLNRAEEIVREKGKGWLSAEALLKPLFKREPVVKLLEVLRLTPAIIFALEHLYDRPKSPKGKSHKTQKRSARRQARWRSCGSAANFA